MKKTFLAKRNALFMSTNFSWGGGALVLACVVLLVRLIAPNLFWYVFTPVFHTADSVATGSRSFISSFSNAAELTRKNEDLANKNAALASENQALAQKIADISNLSGSHGAVLGIIAGVVSRPPESPYDTLVLAAGSVEGVARGQEAFGAGGVPLGVVETVLAHFSRVKLFSASGMTTGGWVGNSNLPLTIVGAGGGALGASAARAAGILVGDIVYVPGPGKLPIGVVSRIDGDPSSPQVTLRITPTLNLFSTTWVLLRDTGVELL